MTHFDTLKAISTHRHLQKISWLTPLCILVLLSGCGDDSSSSVELTCPAGEELVGGRCVLSCNESTPCPEGLICQGDGICVAGCTRTGCTSGQVCNALTERCESVACDNDALEPNAGPSTATTAAPGTITDLSLCPGDEDWYAITIDANTSLRVEIDFSHAVGNLDLHLVGADGILPVALSNSFTDGETLIHQFLNAGTYYARVFSPDPGQSVPYTLYISPLQINCTADSLEPNSTPRAASALTFDAQNQFSTDSLSLCPSDEDWFQFSASRGQIISAEIVFPHADGDLQMQILDTDGFARAGAGSFNDNEYIRYTVENDGDYQLRVFGRTPSTTNSYSLAVGLGGAACSEDAIEPNNDALSAKLLFPGDQTDLTICLGEEDWYEIQADNGQVITIETDFDATQSDIGLTLSLLRDDGTLTGLITSDNISSTEKIVYRAAFPTNRYILRAYRSRGTLNAFYDLSVAVEGSACANDGQEPNDQYLDAKPISAGANLPNLSLCVGDVDWYSIDLQNGQVIDISALFDQPDEDLGIQLYKLNDDGTLISRAGVDSLTANERLVFSAFETGAYVFQVYRSRGTNVATYDLSVNVVGLGCTTDSFEPNDSSDEAVALAAGQQTGLTLCASDDDWYSFSAGNGQTIDLSATFAEGDLGLQLYKLNADGTIISRAGSDGLSLNERVSFLSFEEADYLVRVFRSRGTLTATYDLALNISGAACQDDAQEPNDFAAQASAAGPGSLADRSLCVGDVDWYSIDLQNGQVITAELLFTHAINDLGLQLHKLNADGTTIARVNVDTLSDNETIVYQPFESGTFLLQVYRSRGTSVADYDLNIAVDGVGCVADAFEPNESPQQAPLLPLTGGVATLPGLSLCVGEVDYYLLTLENGQTINAQLNYDTVQTDLGIALIKLNADGTLSTRASADTLNDTETLVHQPFDSGNFLLQVTRSRGATTATYDLDVAITGDVCVTDTFEPNDTSFAAFDLNSSLSGGSFQVADVSLCISDEDWYRVSAQNGQLIDVSLDFLNSEGDLGLQIAKLNADGTIIARVTSDTISDNERALYRPVEYNSDFLIRVFRSRGTTLGEYDLDVSVSGPGCTPDTSEPNEHWLNAGAPASVAAPLAFSGALCEGDTDYYPLTINNGDVRTFTMTFDPAHDPAMRLFRINADNTITTMWTADAVASSTEQMVWTSTGTGNYVLQVFRSRTVEPFDYAITIAP